MDHKELLPAPQDRTDPTPQESAEQLIARVFTGDGAKLENLDLADWEWVKLCKDHGNGPEHFEITVTLDDWLAMGRIARLVHAGPEVAAPARAHQEEKENEKSVSRVDGVPGVGQGDLPRKTSTGDR